MPDDLNPWLDLDTFDSDAPCAYCGAAGDTERHGLQLCTAGDDGAIGGELGRTVACLPCCDDDRAPAIIAELAARAGLDVGLLYLDDEGTTRYAGKLADVRN